MKITPLGTNGYFPSHGRQTMSFLLAMENRVILLDAGSGVGRLIAEEQAAKLAGVDSIDVILSHYHLDHIVGLSYLPAVCAKASLRLHAPGPPLVDAPAIDTLNAFLRPPYFPRTLDDFPVPLKVLEYSQQSLKIGSIEVDFRRQVHPGGSVGMRFGDALAYITDTVVDPATVDFVRGVDLLLHEVWLPDEADATAHGHSWARGVARIAAEAEVGCLVPIHHHPQHSTYELQRMADSMSRWCSVEVLLAKEGDTIDRTHAE